MVDDRTRSSPCTLATGRLRPCLFSFHGGRACPGPGRSAPSTVFGFLIRETWGVSEVRWVASSPAGWTERCHHVFDRIAPRRMGRSFRWLLSATWAANVADGIAIAAGPLLVASLTSNAMLVALAALVQRVPWLVLGLFAGALADRVDRRLMMMVADSLRAVVVGGLSIILVTGQVSIAAVLVLLLLLGGAEVFADTAFQTLLPMLVDSDDLGIGNARLQGAFLLGNHIIGPPVGAFLFAAGMAWPFITQTLLVALSVILIARIATPKGAVREVTDTHVFHDIAEGVRWLVDHPAVRTLALVIVAFNVTWGAAWAVLVLYALDHLNMSEVGFGLLTTSAAMGGLLSTVIYDRIERRFDLGNVMRTCPAAGGPRPSRLRADHQRDRRDGDHVRVRRLRLRVGSGLADGAAARHTHGAAGPRRQRLHGLRVRRHRCRSSPRWLDCGDLGSDGAVLVRVRRIGHHAGPRVAAAAGDRAHRRCRLTLTSALGRRLYS